MSFYQTYAEKIIRHQQNLITILKMKEDNLLKDSILRHGSFIEITEDTFNSVPEVMQEQIKNTRREFFKEFARLQLNNNMNLTNFIIKHTEFSDHVLKEIVQNGFNHGSTEWIKEVCMPLVSKSGQAKLVSFESVVWPLILKKKDSKLLEIISGYVNWQSNLLKDANSLEDLIFITENTVKKLSNLPPPEMQKVLKNNIEYYFTNKIRVHSQKNDRVAEWKNEFEYLANVPEAKKEDLDIHYLLLKLLLKDDEKFKKLSPDTIEVIQYLCIKDDDFENKMKYPLRKFPQIKNVISKIQLQEKLSLELSTNNITIKKNKI
jgi:hypothetical protein